MTVYAVYVEGRLAELLPRLKRTERDRLLRRLERLRTNPFLEGDYTEQDEVGRPIQVLLVGRFAVFFWASHADKKVKVLDLKPAGR